MKIFGVILVIVFGLLMPACAVGFFVYGSVSMSGLAWVLAILAGLAILATPLLFYREVFFWIDWIAFVVTASVVVCGWFALLLLLGLAGMVIYNLSD